MTPPPLRRRRRTVLTLFAAALLIPCTAVGQTPAAVGLTPAARGLSAHVQPFDLASVTKVMATTYAIILLVDRGLIDIDAPVHRYLPGFRSAHLDSITVRHSLVRSRAVATAVLSRDHAAADIRCDPHDAAAVGRRRGTALQRSRLHAARIHCLATRACSPRHVSLLVLLDLLLQEGVYAGRRYIASDVIAEFMRKDRFGHRHGWQAPADAPDGSFAHNGFTGTYVIGVPGDDLGIVLLINRQNLGVGERGYYPGLSIQQRVVRAILR